MQETTGFKRDLAALYDELISKDVPEDDELSVAHSALEVELSDIASKVKGLLAAAPSKTSHPAPDSSEVKLPKLDLPVFDGNIIHWKQFWDQFSVSVHDRTNLSNAEKIVYLQHALKDGSVKNAIEGLSHFGENYDEAVKLMSKGPI